ncbi:phage holin family protein [Mucilaginibacter sp.]|uniref:phage holin family protein n=1 Tax=Mucilaginibacter sp. TaxID=1882438 RepID=UPI0035BC6A46
MEAIPEQIETLFSKAGDYAETKAKLLKLKIADKTSDTLSDAASMLVVMIFTTFFLLIFSVGLALLIGEWLGKSYYGFFIVAGIYGIAGIIFKVNKVSLVKTPVANFIINKVLKTAQ